MKNKLNLAEIRGRVHKKSHDYFVFEYGRWDQFKRNMFYGATDALYDASLAADSYSRLITKDQGGKLLACYGFLQALYIQQDAVQILSRALGLNWHPNNNNRLKVIRDVRNRLTGHPALAGEMDKPPRRLSSAIIPAGDITKSGFRGHIYFEDGFEDIDVDVSKFVEDNEKHLVAQMQAVEKVMDTKERKFRRKRGSPPLSDVFERGFSYLLQRLWCDLNDDNRLLQAKAHAKMLREAMEELQNDLTKRELDSEPTSLYFDRIFRGIHWLERIMKKKSFSKNDHYDFDLIYHGMKKQISKLRRNIYDLDVILGTRV